VDVVEAGREEVAFACATPFSGQRRAALQCAACRRILMDDRLNELEIKLAFQEDLLEALNVTVARQQQQLDLLQEQFRALYQQVRSSASTAAEANPQHEIPPHY
jgi:SlyX protein